MSNPKRSALGTVKSKTATPRQAQVVDLDQVRQARQRALTDRKVRRVLEENRGALRRLFASGLIFSQKGSRAGRGLLGAQLALLKLIDLISRMPDEAEMRSSGARLIFAQLDAQLARTETLNARAGEFVSGRGGGRGRD